MVSQRHPPLGDWTPVHLLAQDYIPVTRRHSGSALNDANMNEAERIEAAVTRFVMVKLNELQGSGLGEKHAHAELAQKWAGMRVLEQSHTSKPVVAVSPLTIAEMQKCRMLGARLNLAYRPTPEGYVVETNIAETYFINANLAVELKKLRGAPRQGMNESDPDQWGIIDFAGVTRYSPQFITEMERLGHLAWKANAHPKPGWKSHWTSQSAITVAKIFQYALVKLKSFIEDGRSVDDALVEIRENLVDIKLCDGRETLCISPTALEELKSGSPSRWDMAPYRRHSCSTLDPSSLLSSNFNQRLRDFAVVLKAEYDSKPETGHVAKTGRRAKIGARDIAPTSEDLKRTGNTRSQP